MGFVNSMFIVLFWKNNFIIRGVEIFGIGFMKIMENVVIWCNSFF